MGVVAVSLLSPRQNMNFGLMLSGAVFSSGLVFRVLFVFRSGVFGSTCRASLANCHAQGGRSRCLARAERLNRGLE